MIVAESMEPEIHSSLDDDDISKVNFRQGDPQVHYQVCASVEKAQEWLDDRIETRLTRVIAVSPWRTGSLGADMNDPSGDTTGTSSIVRDVTYENSFGTFEHWQSVGASWIYGADK